MIEFELILNDLEKMLVKEKSLRRRNYLETAIKNLKEYEKAGQK